MDQQNTISDIPAVQRRIRDNRLVPFREKGGNIVSAEQQAIDPRRGYALGLLLLDRSITQDQHDAGVKYAQDVARHLGLSGIAFPSARAQDLFSVRSAQGEESETRAEVAKRARADVNHMLNKVLLKVGNIDMGRRVAHAVYTVCVMDVIEARMWPEHMTFALRRGLNALILHYGIASIKE